MAAAAQSASSAVLNFAVGTVYRALYEGVASAILWLQYLVLAVLQQAFLSSCTGTQVDTWLTNNFPVFGGRIQAVASSGQITAGRYTTTSSAFIPVGAQFRTLDGTQTFNAIADTTQPTYSSALNGYTIPAGTATASITVQAVTAGSGGNVAANTISQIIGSLPNVDYVNNASAFTNGVAAESDSAVKLRFQNWQETRASGTYAAVEYAISTVSDNLTYQIAQNVNGGLVYTPGSFAVFVDDGSGATPSGTLSTVYNAISGVRPIGTTAYVLAASKLTANISMALTVSAGGTLAAAEAAVSTAISTYIGSLGVGDMLSYTKLAQVAFDAYSFTTNITGLLLNSGTSDLVPTSQQVVRAGTITVS